MTDASVRFANPFLICAQCGGHVVGAATLAGLLSYNLPCRHRAVTLSLCPDWDLLDGCSCVALHGVVNHVLPA